MKFLIIFFILLISSIESSHFRGGIITWKPIFVDSTQALVNVTVKLGWRRSFSYACFCDQNDIKSGQRIIGESGLFASGGTLLQPFNGVYCTDFSLNEDWSYGEIDITIQYLYPYAGIWNIEYSGAAWINLLNGGSTWRLSTKVDLRTQKHTNRINKSPITSMSPLIKIQAGCYQEIRVPIEDPDNDFIRCRWSRGAECGDSCRLPPDVELNEETCLIKFNTTQSIGYYALRIQIEDFESRSSTTAISSVPLQFLVEAYRSSSSCYSSAKPDFDVTTKPDQACVGIPEQETYEEMIIVNGDITEIQTVSPTGMIKSDLFSIGNGSSKYVNLTWSPTTTGVSLLCFIAVTNTSVTSDQRCISLSVGFNAPKPIPGSMWPVGNISANQTEWYIYADKNLTRPKFPSYIRFIESHTERLVYIVNAMDLKEVEIAGNKLSFQTKGDFLLPNLVYFIIFDYGVLTSTESCNVNSEQINSRQFWTILVNNATLIDEEEEEEETSTITYDTTLVLKTVSPIIETGSNETVNLPLVITLPLLFFLLCLASLLSLFACLYKKKKKKRKTVPEDASSQDYFTEAAFTEPQI